MLNSAAADYVRNNCQNTMLTALDLNKLLYDAGITCSSPAKLLEDLYRNGEIALAGTNPGPQRVYRIQSQWKD